MNVSGVEAAHGLLEYVIYSPDALQSASPAFARGHNVMPN